MNMIKRIPIDCLKLGMHLHGLEGPWLNHPFWKSRFTISDHETIAKLRTSGIREAWIDTSKGLDVESDSAPRAAPVPLDAPFVNEAGESPVTVRASQSLADELQRAEEICRQGRDRVASMFREARLGHAIETEACIPLVESITDSVFRNPSALVSLARLKTKDDYSYMHSVAVCALMVALARELGMVQTECRAAGMAGLLHDVGKAMMPPEILNKPGRLTDHEFDVIKQHPVRGHELLLETRLADPASLDVCLHHHERMDGKGYPHGVPGSQIEQLTRMGSICDVYDAITSNRSYKKGWDPAESIARMSTWKGQFDPQLFAAFVKSVGIYPAGSLVRLQSERLAVVIEHNEASLTTPVVSVFYSLRSQMPIPVRTIDLCAAGCTDRILAREPVEKWDVGFLEKLWAREAASRRR